MEIILETIQWFHPVIYIVLIILAATRKRLRAKFWLIAYMAGSVMMFLMWRIPLLALNLNLAKPETFSKFYDWFAIPLSFANILFVCLLVPYILLAPAPKTQIEPPQFNRPPVDKQIS